MASSTRPSRKTKDRDVAAEIANNIVAIQRRNAGATRPRERERSEHPPALPTTRSPPSPSSPRRPHAPHPKPNVLVIHTEDDADDFSRRLKISGSPRASHPHAKPQNKLFNPATDPIPMRRTAEPEAISDASGSHASRGAPKREQPAQRQLYDYRRDGRFSVQARKPTPTPKSSGDYVSVSSVSSYAPSTVSSNFTLSSNTTDSSAPSSLFDRKPRDEAKTNAFSAQLKKLYRDISTLETKILRDDSDENVDEGRVVLRASFDMSSEEAEKARWKKVIEDHKMLAEMMHNLLEISLAPSVPASLRSIPEKYRIVIRLWSHAFHRLLENLRRSSLSSKIAMEHLQDFIYYAYTFYSGLLEEHALSTFKSNWQEALGDLARYHMAVSAMVTATSLPPSSLTVAAMNGVSELSPGTTDANISAVLSSISDRPSAPIDEPSASVGIAAARLFDLEPEKERWRSIARNWYALGVNDMPGNGKLHHHLGLLSREVEGEELRGIYHFVKSMITTHPFATSRESVLMVWSSAAQARRVAPDAHAVDLFVLLHGMLFTKIQLDDFAPTLARFLERLSIEDPQAREWIMMAVVNIGSLLEYGRSHGVLLEHLGIVGGQERPVVNGGVKVTLAKKQANGDDKMDVDSETSPALSNASVPAETSPAFKMASQLAFGMLAHVLKAPERHDVLNPYITILLSFLGTVSQQPKALALLECSVPWELLASFLAQVPRRILKVGPTKPTLGSKTRLPEDWCIRGMAWGGRRLYDPGYWKSGEDKMEMEVLDEVEERRVDGMIEDDHDEEDKQRVDKLSMPDRRWLRAFWAGERLVAVEKGFVFAESQGRGQWSVEGDLAEKVHVWAEEDRAEREEEERRKRGTRWGDDSMEIDDDGLDGAEESSEQSEEDESDSEEVKALKARRRYLRSLLQSSEQDSSFELIAVRPRGSRKPAAPRRSLKLVPGYTILVVDTNILLSSLPMLASLIKSMHWTVVVPLPVIMELDGLATNESALGEAAKDALAFLVSHVRSHETSLKVQTSKGNYLSTLSVRTEQVDFDNPESWERNMDDLILKAAIWQDEHWADRSAFLSVEPQNTASAAKVVLLSLDRNLRLKARSRQLDAANEKDLAALLASARLCSPNAATLM